MLALWLPTRATLPKNCKASKCAGIRRFVLRISLGLCWLGKNYFQLAQLNSHEVGQAYGAKMTKHILDSLSLWALARPKSLCCNVLATYGIHPKIASVTLTPTNMAPDRESPQEKNAFPGTLP